MLVLAFTVCMMASPYACKPVNLFFDAGEVTAYRCILKGQVEMARWIVAHPGWEIGRDEGGAAYRCGPPELAQRGRI